MTGCEVAVHNLDDSRFGSDPQRSLRALGYAELCRLGHTMVWGPVTWSKAPVAFGSAWLVIAFAASVRPPDPVDRRVAGALGLFVSG